MNRILLKSAGALRKFISFYQDEKDGSLYLTQRRVGYSESTSYLHMKDLDSAPEDIRTIASPHQKNFEVHYHTTGRINYPEPEFGRIFAEPLTRITQPFWFASFVIPNFESLDLYDKPLAETDFVFFLEGNPTDRRQFDLCLSPSGAHIASYGRARAHFTHAPFYTLNVIETDNPVVKLKDDSKFMLFAPRKGLFSNQQITREAAHIEYQQKLHGHNGPIIYGPNVNYEYRVIFQVAATTPPKVEAELPDANWKLDIIKVRESEVRFRVLDARGKIVRVPIAFSRVELSDFTATLFI
jgi:hypothetical protein